MQVYISYAAQDENLAIALAKEIREAGWDVWSPDSSAPGANWAAEMGNALEQSDVMIVLLTKDAQYFTRLKQDVQYALTEGKYHGRLIPVLVNLSSFQAGLDVPWILNKFQALRVSGSPPDFSEVLKHLNEVARDDSNATA